MNREAVLAMNFILFKATPRNYVNACVGHHAMNREGVLAMIMSRLTTSASIVFTICAITPLPSPSSPRLEGSRTARLPMQGPGDRAAVVTTAVRPGTWWELFCVSSYHDGPCLYFRNEAGIVIVVLLRSSYILATGQPARAA